MWARRFLLAFLSQILLAAFLVACSYVSLASELKPVLDIASEGSAHVPLADAVAGWQFHLDRPLTIAAVGLWDEGSQPLEIAHQVGLWKADQTFLFSVFVDNSSLPVASASADGQWLFSEITPLTLLPGDYVMAAVWGDSIIGADPFRFGAVAVAPLVAYTGPCDAFLLPSPDLVFPDCHSGILDAAGYFGPNLAVVVPEPNCLAILGTAVVGLFAVVRRKI
jgi:hypothetical protein